MRQAYPNARLIVCADDDIETRGNPGLMLASAAAREIGALIAVPTFGVGRVAGETDFNDLHRTQGLDAVRAALDGGLTDSFNVQYDRTQKVLTFAGS